MQLQLAFKKDGLITNEEKRIKKKTFRRTKIVNILHDTFFIYDRSALVKQSFITELNRFLPTYCSVSNFSEKKEKRKIVSSQNQQKCFIEKTTEKDSLSLQITKVSGKEFKQLIARCIIFRLQKLVKRGNTK